MPSRRLPSPLLWSIVVNDLILRLTKAGFVVVAYADDLAISATAARNDKNLSNTVDRMNYAMNIVAKWCKETGLNVNPEKSNFIIFDSVKHKSVKNVSVKLFGRNIPRTKTFKYLGVIVDENLNWREHVDWAVEKGRRTLWVARSMVAKSWGINPKKMLWLYNQIVLPRVLYGVVVWWKRTQLNSVCKKLARLIRMALMMVTGATWNYPY